MWRFTLRMFRNASEKSVKPTVVSDLLSASLCYMKMIILISLCESNQKFCCYRAFRCVLTIMTLIWGFCWLRAINPSVRLWVVNLWVYLKCYVCLPAHVSSLWIVNKVHRKENICFELHGYHSNITCNHKELWNTNSFCLLFWMSVLSHTLDFSVIVFMSSGNGYSHCDN